MRNVQKSNHWNDNAGNPDGGTSFGPGFAIAWQRGPLGRDENRKEQNGAFVEDVLEACLDRIKFLNAGKFKCKENDDAIVYIESALYSLNTRTQNRESRKVEGTVIISNS